MSQAEGSPGLPEGLEIEWEKPDDADLFWSMDRMHFPGPITEIDDAFVRSLTERGINFSLQQFEIPLRVRARRFWNYHYAAAEPLPVSDEEMEAMATRSEAKVQEAMEQFDERWESEWLPEIKEHLDFWDRFPLRDASMPELLQHLDESFDRLGRVWEIHFSLADPMMLAINQFDEFYQEVFEPESPLRPYQLLQGFPNKTLENDRELWKLSRKALSSPEVRAIVEENAAADVIPALESTEQGQQFLAELHVYLEAFGHRGETWGISYPTWIEQPTPVIERLKGFVRQPDRDPDLELATMIAERDQLIAEAREKLQGYPEVVRDQFESSLKQAQIGNVLSEDHGYWIDFRSTAAARRVFVELGRRFADAGVLEQPDDVFHLTMEEIRETGQEFPEIVRIQLVQTRKADIEHARTIQPPLMIGTPPPEPPPDDLMTRTTGKFFGTPPEPSDEPGLLNGAGGSSGLARGTARVVRNLAEATKIQPGDILVAETTAPPWTPLFGSVAAVVTDTGGILSHCAVVAREYGIPAVVGTGTATTTISDGQTIEVDGDRGTVRVIG